MDKSQKQMLKQFNEFLKIFMTKSEIAQFKKQAIQQQKEQQKILKKQQQQEKKELKKQEKQFQKIISFQQKQEQKELKKQQKIQEKEQFKLLSKEQKKQILQEKKIQRQQIKEQKQQIKEQKQQEKKQKLEEQKQKIFNQVENQIKQQEEDEDIFQLNQVKIRNVLVNEIVIDDVILQEEKTLQNLLFKNKELLINRLLQVFNENGKIKICFQCIILTEEEKNVMDEKGEITLQKVKKNQLLKSDYIYRIDSNNRDNILKIFDEFDLLFDEASLKLKHSGIKIKGVKYFYIKCLKYDQEIGQYIELDDVIKNKQVCKNIQNKDNYCLIYCYMLQRYINKMQNLNNDKKVDLKNLERQSMYQFYIKDNILFIQSVNKIDISEQINVEGINFPCSESDIIKFSNRTKTNISVFEYQIDEEQQLKLYPLVNQFDQTFKQNLDLLLIQDENNQHLVLITNYNGLLKNKNGNKNQYFCRRCQCCFDQKQKMINHYNFCVQEKKIVSRDVYPQQGINDTIQFKNLKQSVQIPYFFVGDFESILIKLQNQQQNIKNKELNQIDQYEKTEKIEQHQVLSYGLQVVSFDKKDDQYIEYVSDNSQDVIKHFMNTVIQKSLIFEERINKLNIPFNLTKQQQIDLKNKAKTCYLCNKQFKNISEKMTDHNHLTGEVRGIACRNCNLQFNLYRSKIPVIFHNLRNYDSHFIIQYVSDVIKQKVEQIDQQINDLKNNYEQNKQQIIKLTKEKSNIKRLDCIVQNNEKVQSFTYNNNKFIDSFQFLNTSLAKLGEKLKAEQKQYTINYIKNKYNFLSDEKILQLINKGIFPYQYLDNYSKLKQTEFPKYKYFFSNLSQENISKKDYEFAKNLYQELKMKNFEEYLLFYQAIDVKLLTDVWINFRNECLKFYQLDPGFFVSLPSFSFQAMLKMTNIKLELITNPEIYQMFEKSIRGGVANTGSINYAQANNKYLQNYDNTKQISSIQYLDINNLYGNSMLQKLPICDFKFVENFTEEQIQNYDENSNTGFLIQADLIYPKEIHDFTNCYPLLPQKINTKKLQLSDYQNQLLKKICEQNNIEINQSNVEKLIPNLFDKNDYICDIRVLKLYLQLGIKIKQIKKVVSFYQSDFLKPFIDFNTQQRNIAKQNKDDFKTDFFKLMNNSLYGKTLENVRNRGNYKLVFDKQEMQKIINKRYFKNYIQINQECLLVSQYNKETLLNRPIYLGSCILDLSKYKMYDFFYNHIKKIYNNVQLLFTDTDSLIVKINGEIDIYDKMIENNQYYDFSSIKPTSPLYNKLQQYFIDNNMNQEQQDNFIQNSMQIGRAKDENINDIITEFAGIKAKCYSYLTKSNLNIKKNKGVKKQVVEKQITHQDYIQCIFNNQVKQITQYQIRSYNHQLFTIKQEKLALQSLNDKRYYLNENQSFAHGHYTIKYN